MGNLLPSQQKRVVKAAFEHKVGECTRSSSKTEQSPFGLVDF